MNISFLSRVNVSNQDLWPCLAVSAGPLRWSSSHKGVLRPHQAGKELDEGDTRVIYETGSGTRKVNGMNDCSLPV